MTNATNNASNNNNSKDSRQKHKRGSSLSARTSLRSGNDSTRDRSDSQKCSSERESSQTRHRQRSLSSHHRRPRSRSRGCLDKSLRTDDTLPERLGNMLDRSSCNASHLEQLALSILVAEGEGELNQEIRDAMEKLPAHLLDPSKVRLSMQW